MRGASYEGGVINEGGVTKAQDHMISLGLA